MSILLSELSEESIDTMNIDDERKKMYKSIKNDSDKILNELLKIDDILSIPQ